MRKTTFCNYIWVTIGDFQQCGSLTSVVSDQPAQPPFKLRNSKWCSVSSLNSQRISKRLAKTLIRPGWSEALLVAHTTLLEIPCRGSFISTIMTNGSGDLHLASKFSGLETKWAGWTCLLVPCVCVHVRRGDNPFRYIQAVGVEVHNVYAWHICVSCALHVRTLFCYMVRFKYFLVLLTCTRRNMLNWATFDSQKML